MRNRISAVLFVAALAIVSVEARAALIVNGDFDANPVSGGFAIVTPSSAFQITGWRVLTSGGNTSASVDLVKAPYWQAHSGANSVDLFGTRTQQPSFLAQTFLVGPGELGAYRLSFFYSVNADTPRDQGLFANIVTGTGVAGTSVASSTTSFLYDTPTDGNPTRQAMAWKQGVLDVSFAAAGDYTLWFRGNNQFGNANQGAVLDSVTLDAAVVPLPAAGWLMLAGMGMVFGLGRQRRFASA
jgi:hypothetical protein